MGYLSDQVLAITHAFSDQPRKNGIRELAAKVEAVEQHARELDYKLGLALHDSEQGIADADESEACLKAENATLREKFAEHVILRKAYEEVRDELRADLAALRERVAHSEHAANLEASALLLTEKLLAESREKLAVATQGLQRIKAKTTNVMAMVWSEETLKKLGVE